MRIHRPAMAMLAAAGLSALILALTLPAGAQTFDDAIHSALDNNCRGLKGAGGSYDSSLAAICAAVPTPSGFATGGASVATLTPGTRTAEERRILERLQDKREAARDGGLRAASADAARTGLDIGRLSLFVSGEFEKTAKDKSGFETGFSSDTGGVTVGGDLTLTDWLLAGGAFTYTLTKGDFDNFGGHFTTDAYSVLLYASVLPMPNLFVDLTTGYTRRDHDILRRNSYTFVAGGVRTIIDGLASGQTNANEFRMGAQTGYDFVLKALTVGPRLGLNYRTNAIDAFREFGRERHELDTGIELAYFAQHFDSLTLSSGIFVSHAISTPLGVIIPQGTIEYVHEFMNDQRVIYFRFLEDHARTKLRFQTDAPDRDYANVSVGVVWQLPRDVSVFANYRALVAYEDRLVHTMTAGVRIGF